jgi:16S rRNA (cytosine1402-N4)-methyltransferase
VNASEPESAPLCHIPVLLDEILEYSELEPGMVVVDGTLGAGGHAREILKRILPGGKLIAIDRDPAAAAAAKALLDAEFPDAKAAGAIRIFNASYRDLPYILQQEKLESVDRILVDLGLSSDQLADRDRGFSFKLGGPLDLRFNPEEGIPASVWIEREKEETIANAIYQYGEERFSRRIAKAICLRRLTDPIKTAEQLTDLIHRCVPGKIHGRVDSATRTFQALRIVVNEELKHLEEALKKFPDLLALDGRFLAISFHSLEDRLVKNAFRDHPTLERVTKKPVVASPAEEARNPRSRSAKLRVARRFM